MHPPAFASPGTADLGQTHPGIGQGDRGQRHQGGHRSGDHAPIQAVRGEDHDAEHRGRQHGPQGGQRDGPGANQTPLGCALAPLRQLDRIGGSFGSPAICPDDRPHLIEPARDHGLEVRPRLDVIDVAKHRARTEALLERVGEPTSEAGAVVAAIGDEHARHGGG